MRIERPRPRSDPADRVGFALIAGGGCLTLAIVPLILVAGVGFVLMLAVGFASDTQATATEAEGVYAGVILGVLAFSVLLAALWFRALYGGAIATALVGCVGIAGTWFVARTWLGWESGLERPEDRSFLAMFVLFALPPLALVAGAAIRLAVCLRRVPPST
ncbi:MAG: hypothetical protein ACKOTZ_13540 [Chloroflexota bacterium]